MSVSSSARRRSLRTWLPHRIRGKHEITTDGWQILGGRSWSLVLFTHVKKENA